MITAVPTEMPVTIPDDEPIIAFVLLLLQVPPEEGLLSVVVCPIQTYEVPLIVPGIGYTVALTIARHPDESE